MAFRPSFLASPVLLAAISGLVLPASARAQALEIQPASATALSLAGAGVTAVKAPAALWQNPANMVQSDTRVAAGLSLESSGRSVFRLVEINAASPESRDGSGVQPAAHAALVLPLWERWLWAGIGYHLQLNLHSAFPVYGESTAEDLPSARRTDRARFSGTELQLQQHVFSLGLAGRFKQLALGLALELSHVRLAHRRSLWAGFQGDRAKLEDASLNVDASLSASGLLDAGALLGVWFRPFSFLELGLALRLPVRSRLQGSLQLEPGKGVPHGYAGWSARGGDVELELLLPLELRGGVAVAWRALQLHLELCWRQWSALEDLVARPDDAALLLSQQVGRAENWPVQNLPLGIQLQDQLSVRAGVQLRLWSGFLTLNAGYAYHQGGTGSESPVAVLLDLDRHVLGLGLQLALWRVQLGLAVQHSFKATLDATGRELLLHNPLDSSVTNPVGEGHYSTELTRVLVEARVGW